MYKRSLQGGLKHLDFLLIDIVCLHIAFILSYVSRHGGGNPYAIEEYASISIVLSLIDIVVANLFGSLKNVLKRGYYKEFAMTIKHVCLVELLMTFYLFVVGQGSAYSRLLFMFFPIYYVIVSYIGRILWKRALIKWMSVKKNRSLLVITTQEMADSVLKNIQVNSHEIYHVCGAVVIDKDRQGEKINNISIVANQDNVAEYVCREWVDEVLLVFPNSPSEYHQDLVDKLMEMGVVVHTMITFPDKWMNQKSIVERLGGYTVLTTSINHATTFQLFAKRSLDIVVSLVGCLMTGMIFIFIAPVIYIKSPGPIFFTQTRVGKNGKKFKMYKFRSMYMDAEKRKKDLIEQYHMEDEMMFKLEGDPRIIGCVVHPDGTFKKGIGNFIRDTSLDEFPQFFNVLKGDMSLVGTRPPTLDEWDRYEFHHRSRLAIKPGMTGMWQVSGRSQIKDFEEVVKLDNQYIVDWSMGLDLRILFKTVGVVLGRVGSM